MQLNKIMKGVLIALPVVTLMACSSSPSSSDAEAARNDAGAATSSSTGTESAAVEVGSVTPEKSPEEIRQETIDSLSTQLVYFDFDRSNIKSEYYSILNEHADFLIKNPGQSIVIEGHCDKRGTPEYNIALGERRAKSVETFLQNAGVSRSQISVVSYGEEKPIALGDTESAFSQNRRAVVVYQ